MKYKYHILILFLFLAIPVTVYLAQQQLDIRQRAAAPAQLPAGFSESVYVSGIQDGTHLAFAPDGRLFIVEQGDAGGPRPQIRIFKNGQLLPEPFAVIDANDTNENGIHGIVFDPQFELNGYIYMYYTKSSNQAGRVARITAQGDHMVPGSEFVILDVPQGASSNIHNGGSVIIKDGKLLVALGERGDPESSQSMTSLLGKVLRYNLDGTIPEDNPFYNSTTGIYRAIYALGFRNPYAMALQPGTGRIFLNDVGQGGQEEINDVKPGKNYGWPRDKNGYLDDPAYEGSVYHYDHNGGTALPGGGCAITGGTFYNPPVDQFPQDYVGDYFFTDWCGDGIYQLKLQQNPPPMVRFMIPAERTSPTDVIVGPDGALYMYGNRNGNGFVNRYAYVGGNIAPSIISQPSNVSGTLNQQVTFSVTANGTAPLSYQWMKNGTAITGATSFNYSFTAKAADNNTKYSVRITNPYGSVTSQEATLTVIAGKAPTVTLQTPATTTKFKTGDTISFSATANDPEEGALPASAFIWNIEFYHFDTPPHVHDLLAVAGVSSGTVTVPVNVENTVNLKVRFTVKVTDASGLSTTVTRDISPITSSIKLLSNPAGLKMKIDGTETTSTNAFGSIVNDARGIGVVSPQKVGCKTYTFRNWADGSTVADRLVNTAATQTTYTANYDVVDNTCVVSGLIFIDQDRDGLRDPIDNVFTEGAVVEILSNNVVVKSSRSNSQGIYSLDGLKSGNYSLRLVLPTSYEKTTTNPIAINLSADTQKNFGMVATATVTPAHSPTPTRHPYDLTGDNRVTIKDYNILMSNLYSAAEIGDYNMNTVVDIYDYNALIKEFASQ